MNISIQTIYLISASIGILAMIPQIKKLLIVKQSDSFSLTTWMVWVCCQVVSFTYASSIGAHAYMYVHATYLLFYIMMVFLIVKYRKRRGLIETLLYWKKRGREEEQDVIFKIDNLFSSLKTGKELKK